jgi:hypothetical protein
MMITLTGCGGDDQQQVAALPPPPPPPPPPPAPSVTPIEQLMAEMNIDPRIVFPEDQAPDNDEDRRAVLEFFDAQARGNAQAMRTMLPLAEQLQLTDMVEDGTWEATVAKILQIRVHTGTNSLSQKCALAVIEVGDGPNLSFQPQLWYYTTSGDEAQFEAAPTPPGIIDRLSGDWIASWHQILAAEMAKSQEPDEDLALAQKNIDSSENSPSSTGASPGGGGGAPTRTPGGTPGSPPRGPSSPPM